MVISSVWETSCFTAATVGAGVSTNPGGGTQVCAVVLPTVPIHAIEANKLTITTRLILRYSYIPIIVTYRAHASAVKPRIGPHQGRTRAVEAISLADNAKPSD